MMFCQIQGRDCSSSEDYSAVSSGGEVDVWWRFSISDTTWSHQVINQ